MTDINDIVMKKWLDENPIDEERDVIPVGKALPIPLSYEDFIEWLLVHPNIKFQFAKGGSRQLIIYSEAHHLHLLIKLVGGREIKYNERQEIDINRILLPTNRILDEGITFYRRYGDLYILETLVPFERISAYCDEKLKLSYMKEAHSTDQIFEKAVNKEWWDFAINLFPFSHKLRGTETETIFRRRPIKNSGREFIVVFEIIYQDLLYDEILEILKKRKDLEITISKHIDFGYYIMNIISIKIFEITYWNTINNTESTILTIEFITELITPDDYYNTFGFYKAWWENACVKKSFVGGRGIRELASELQIDNVQQYDDDSLCQKINEQINNLQFSDFETDLVDMKP